MASMKPDDYVDKTLIFSLHERLGRDRFEEPVQIGIPLPLGEYRHTDRIGLCTDSDDTLPEVCLDLVWLKKSKAVFERNLIDRIRHK